MTDVTWTDKQTGDQFTAANANEVKTAVNSKADSAEVPAAQVAEISTLPDIMNGTANRWVHATTANLALTPAELNSTDDGPSISIDPNTETYGSCMYEVTVAGNDPIDVTLDDSNMPAGIRVSGWICFIRGTTGSGDGTFNSSNTVDMNDYTTPVLGEDTGDRAYRLWMWNGTAFERSNGPQFNAD